MGWSNCSDVDTSCGTSLAYLLVVGGNYIRALCAGLNLVDLDKMLD